MRLSLAALAVGALSFAIAAFCAYALGLVVMFVGYNWQAHVSPLGPVAPALAFLTTALLVGVALIVLFGSAARFAAGLRLPPWGAVAAAGMFGGAWGYWFLLFVTVVNGIGFGVKLPYWRYDFTLPGY